MTTYKTALEVIGKDQSAVVIFTHGEHFINDPAGNGSTGNWVIDPETVEDVDKVIIYLRQENESINRIFLGNYAGLRSSDIPKRYIIRFSRLQEVGTSDSNWTEFASAGQNPVSYVMA
jgi:hypothetical protein